MQYAVWTHGDAVLSERHTTGAYATNVEGGGLFPTGVRQLLWDLNLLDGIPDENINAYVRELMLRADQVSSGLRSAWVESNLAYGRGSEHVPTCWHEHGVVSSLAKGVSNHRAGQWHQQARRAPLPALLLSL